MAANVLYTNTYLPVPQGLVFEGSTDDQGRIVLSFSKKELLLGSDFEIGIDSFTVDSSTMYNILSKQYTIVFKEPTKAEVRKYLPEARITTCLELLKQIDELGMGFVMDFSHPHALTLDLKEGQWSLPVRLARSLSIAIVEYKVNPLVMRLNPNFSFYEEKLTIDSVPIDYIRIKADSSDKFHMPISFGKNIWNTVSTHSFQSLYFYSDLVVTEIISGARVPFLGIYPFKETELINVWRDIEPIWRRVNRERIASCYVQVADSRGRFFKNMRISLHVKIRKRDLK